MSNNIYKLRVSTAAQADLDKIWHYTSKKWSIAQADEYYLLLSQEMQNLCANPFIGNNADEIRKDYRVLIAKSHLIFCKITENESINVIRILHQSVNISSWIK